MKTNALLIAACFFSHSPPSWAQVQQAWVRSTNGAAVALKLGTAGEVYVAGSAVGTNGTSDFLTLKYDSDCNSLWSVYYNGPSNAVDFASALSTDGGGNAYVTGISGDAIATVKYDSSGHQL